MAIGVIWDPPVDQQGYEAIRDRVLPKGLEKGMQAHAAGQGEGGWRIMEIWESREGFDRFVEEDLTPAFQEFGQDRAPDPHSIFEIVYQRP